MIIDGKKIGGREFAKALAEAMSKPKCPLCNDTSQKPFLPREGLTQPCDHELSKAKTIYTQAEQANIDRVAGKWISVSEKLPDVGKWKDGDKKYWLYDPAAGVRFTTIHPAWWNLSRTRMKELGCHPEDQPTLVTHWQPFIVPSPPEKS